MLVDTGSRELVPLLESLREHHRHYHRRERPAAAVGTPAGADREAQLSVALADRRAEIMGLEEALETQGKELTEAREKLDAM